jgi:hypothetical protein
LEDKEEEDESAVELEDPKNNVDYHAMEPTDCDAEEEDADAEF